LDSIAIATTLLCQRCSRVVDEDSPHGFGCRTKKVTSRIPLSIMILRVANNSQPRFVNQSGGLKSVIRSLIL
jgi:hypothetical protein